MSADPLAGLLAPSKPHNLIKPLSSCHDGWRTPFSLAFREGAMESSSRWSSHMTSMLTVLHTVTSGVAPGTP